MAVGQVPAIIELQKLNPSAQENEEKTHRMVERAELLIDELCDYKPWSAEQKEAGEAIVDAVKALMLAIVTFCPDTPGRSRVLNQCMAVRMEANAVITHGGNY